MPGNIALLKRTLRVDGRFTRHGKPLTVSEIIDLKIAVQTMIFYEACEPPDA